MKGSAISAKTKQNLRTRTGIITVILLIIVIMAAALFVYNIFAGFSLSTGKLYHFVFAILYLAATLALLMYILITFSMTFSTVLATDKKSLIMKRWNNCLLPYNIDSKIPFFGDFIPAKTKIVRVPIKDIDTLIIGTKRFISRASENEAFDDAVQKLESKSKGIKNAIGRLDIIYVETINGKCSYMSIKGYDEKSVIKVVQSVCRVNPDIKVQAASRQYRKLSNI